MDADCIPNLVRVANSIEEIATAHKRAKVEMAKVGLKFPKKSCAATLSALLQQAEIPVPMTLGAGKLANILGGKIDSRGWAHIPVGQQRPGDVGVAFDNSPPDGADHVYLVAKVITEDEMLIADNQGDVPHTRFASGKPGNGAKGTTPTDYFLRAT